MQVIKDKVCTSFWDSLVKIKIKLTIAYRIYKKVINFVCFWLYYLENTEALISWDYRLLYKNK